MTGRRYCDDHEIEAFEKMTLSISILISQTVFLSLLAKRIPETSLDIPLLGGYLLFTMSMVSVRVVLAKSIHLPTDRVFIWNNTQTRSELRFCLTEDNPSLVLRHHIGSCLQCAFSDESNSRFTQIFTRWVSIFYYTRILRCSKPLYFQCCLSNTLLDF